jgi:hypothetical protein
MAAPVITEYLEKYNKTQGYPWWMALNFYGYEPVEQ